jgi:hypothetical protein
VALFVISQAISVANDTWLANWSANPASKPLHVWLGVCTSSLRIYDALLMTKFFYD